MGFKIPQPTQLNSDAFGDVMKLAQVRENQSQLGSVEKYMPKPAPGVGIRPGLGGSGGSGGVSTAAPWGGGVMSAEQVADLVWKTGIRDPETIARMVAISRRESSWNPNARLNDGVRDNSWGLWQINVLPNANPKYAGWNLADPTQNARAMFELSRGGQNLAPWFINSDGSAKYTGYDIGKYMGEARAAANAVARRYG